VAHGEIEVKIEQQERQAFQPITITLETPLEVAVLVAALGPVSSTDLNASARRRFPRINEEDVLTYELYSALNNALDRYR
jgi:hypothetical protein